MKSSSSKVADTRRLALVRDETRADEVGREIPGAQALRRGLSLLDIVAEKSGLRFSEIADRAASRGRRRTACWRRWRRRACCASTSGIRLPSGLPPVRDGPPRLGPVRPAQRRRAELERLGTSPERRCAWRSATATRRSRSTSGKRSRPCASATPSVRASRCMRAARARLCWRISIRWRGSRC